MAEKIYTAEELKDQIETIRGNVFPIIDGVTVGEVATEGISMRVGNKLVKFAVESVQELPVDEMITELKKKFNEKLIYIKELFNKNTSELIFSIERSKREYEEKERVLTRRLSEANIMPDISFKHSKQGLSIVRGDGDFGGSGYLVWLYQAVYFPKFVDHKPIDPKFIKNKLMTPITIAVVTKDDKVTEVRVFKTMTLEKFDHYHRSGGGDCWGNWSYDKNWKTPDDIIRIAKRAEAVLENINSHSVGTNEPRGFPRLSTVQQNMFKEEGKSPEYKFSKEDERTGVAAVATTPTSEAVASVVWDTAS